MIKKLHFYYPSITFVALLILLMSCQARHQSPEQLTRKLIENYQHFQPGNIADMFIEQDKVQIVADELDGYPAYYRKSVLEGNKAYRKRLAKMVSGKQKSFKIDWEKVSFSKVIIDASHHHNNSLQSISLRVLFKEKLMFQQSVKLVKLQGKLYIWQLGAYDRYRDQKKM